MFNKFWGAFMAFAGVMWLVDAVRVVYDHGYQPTKLTLVIAFVTTGFVVLKWATEYWNDER